MISTCFPTCSVIPGCIGLDAESVPKVCQSCGELRLRVKELSQSYFLDDSVCLAQQNINLSLIMPKIRIYIY